MMPTERISVAAIAPVWTVEGVGSFPVAILNDASYLSTTQTVRSASAFGGSVSLQPSELAELANLAAEPERKGSTDSRLLVPGECAERVLDWFVSKGPARWSIDIVREVREEALEEGLPVFSEEAFNSLEFHYKDCVRTILRSDELQSAGARTQATTYQWWIYRVHCNAEVWRQVVQSPRVIIPTASEIAKRLAGDVRLSATLEADIR